MTDIKPVTDNAAGNADPGGGEQARAYLAVQRALRSGELTRPWGCSRCGNQETCGPHAHHHNGYQDPLDVIWLCRLCLGHCVTTNRECAIYQPKPGGKP